MRYLGGKFRQSKEIVKAIRRLHPNFRTYVEPFCGAMWSACAMIKEFPGRIYYLSDCNPYLMSFWCAAVKDGWNPPHVISQADYDAVKKRMDVKDPMTGYVGFAWSFGGKFFGGLARDRKGCRDFGKGSFRSTMRKVSTLRNVDVRLKCCDYRKALVLPKSAVYLDPPYENRTRQARGFDFDRQEFVTWADRQATRATVVSTEFVNDRDWRLLHDYGDTVVRHLNATEPDGTHELLMEVRSV